MSQRTNSSPTKTNRLTLFREVMGVDFSLCLYRVSVSIFFGPDAKILNLKARDT
jgi:hypothetical protein